MTDELDPDYLLERYSGEELRASACYKLGILAFLLLPPISDV